MNRAVLVAVDAAVMGTAQVASGYVAHRLRPGSLDRDRWLFRERRFERGGRLYVDVFRIRRWKRRLPEAGDVFPGGFHKAHLLHADDEHLRRHVRETRRAEAAHWLAVGVAPLFFLWNPWYAGVVVQVYAVLVNGPCILAQRYNRIRLERVLARRRAGRSPSASS